MERFGQDESDETMSGSTKRLADESRQVVSAARSLADSVERLAADLETVFKDKIQSQPTRMLVTAAGIGFVLGGGLTARLTALALGFGSRLALAMVAQRMSGRPAMNAAPATSGPGGGALMS